MCVCGWKAGRQVGIYLYRHEYVHLWHNQIIYTSSQQNRLIRSGHVIQMSQSQRKWPSSDNCPYTPWHSIVEWSQLPTANCGPLLTATHSDISKQTLPMKTRKDISFSSLSLQCWFVVSYFNHDPGNYPASLLNDIIHKHKSFPPFSCKTWQYLIWSPCQHVFLC